MTDRRLWRGAAILLALATLGAVIWFSPLRESIEVDRLVRWARTQRDAWWAIPAYFVLYALLDVLFIPTQALSIAAVLLWGWWRGGIIELFAATAGAVLPYLISRGALREPIAARLSRHRATMEVLDREGFTLLLILRVIPIIPYTLLNYVAGLSSLRLGAYIAATVIGMIPSVFIFAYFVDAVIAGVTEPREVMVRAIGGGLLFVALVIVTRLAAPWVRRRVESADRTVSPRDAADRD